MPRRPPVTSATLPVRSNMEQLYHSGPSCTAIYCGHDPREIPSQTTVRSDTGTCRTCPHALAPAHLRRPEACGVTPPLRFPSGDGRGPQELGGAQRPLDGSRREAACGPCRRSSARICDIPRYDSRGRVWCGKSRDMGQGYLSAHLRQRSRRRACRRLEGSETERAVRTHPHEAIQKLAFDKEKTAIRPSRCLTGALICVRLMHINQYTCI